MGKILNSKMTTNNLMKKIRFVLLYNSVLTRRRTFIVVYVDSGKNA